MASYLVDVNVWIAIVYEDHLHHRTCRNWFAGLGRQKAAVCRITQMGLLRQLTNPSVMRESVCTQQEAWKVYETLMRQPATVFLYEPDQFDVAWKKLTSSARPNHHLWTDAYLATFAQLHCLTLVTTDGPLARANPHHLLLS